VTPPLRLALIGCGRAAERLWLPAVRAVTATRLTAVVDPRADRRELIGRSGAAQRLFERADALFASASVDAAIVATPPETHATVARLALVAGVPVLVEKPLAPHPEEAREIAALVEKTGVPLMVGFNRRWWQPAVQLREVLAAVPVGGRMEAQLTFVAVANRWAAIAGAGDLLDDLGSHQFDLLRFLFNTEIHTVSAHHRSAHEIQAVVRLAGGASATCRLAHAGIHEESLRIVCDGRPYRAYDASERLTPADGPVRRGLDLGDTIWRRLRGGRGPLLGSFVRELDAFTAALRSGRQPVPGPGDGVAAARAVAAARESLGRGGLEVSAV
jgi:predicted dehydrogenase